MSTRGRSLLAVALAVAFSIALIASIVGAQASIRQVATTVSVAQADRYRIDLRRRLERGAPGPDVLESFLEAHAEDGLRYVALVGPRRRMSAGTPLGPPWPEVASRERRRTFGDRRRLDMNVSSRIAIVFEYEPLLLSGLEEGGRLALILGIAASLLAVAVAWAYRRALLARATLEREVERDRHLAGLGTMSATLAHELRNPLTSLRGHALLLEESVSEASRPKVRQVLEDATRLERLITDLLDFARQGALERTAVDVAALVRTSLDARGVTSDRLSAGEAPPQWSLDERRFRQVVDNLIDNAVQATPEGAAPPLVSLGWEDGRLILRVRDHGPGLPEGDPEDLFEPFVTHRARGTGLGLAVVHRIVVQHGGSITAENHPGGGAVFTVRVPSEGGGDDGSNPGRR